MNDILIVGNILKDVYLNLSQATTKSELDQQDHPCMDLNFDASTYPYSSRNSFYGGSAIIAETLSIFGHKPYLFDAAYTQNQELSLRTQEIDYRYIVTLSGHLAYLSPENRRFSTWQIPNFNPRWIFIDFSAKLDLNSIKSITNYLAFSSYTRLVLCLPNNPSPELQKLSKFAHFIFAESPIPKLNTRAKICLISECSITLNNHTMSFSRTKAHFLTHLCLKNLIAGTIFSSLLSGETDKSSLVFAKYNAENAIIGRSLNKTELKRLILEKTDKADIRLIAKTLMSGQKGILAADESGGSIHKKFEALDIEDTAKNRRDYRNIFFTTPYLSDFVNGVILFDETARQLADSGETFSEFLIRKKIIPGIKVDEGLAIIPGTAEKYTKGLENLPIRLEEYYKMGMRFAKWRTAFEVSLDNTKKVLTPTDSAIVKNCQILAKYAKYCQEAHVVPIVEPELVHDGDYDINICKTITEKILKTLFIELKNHQVDLKGCILKCNMVLAGKKHSTKSSPSEVGTYTADTLLNNVPKDLAGIVFLSGGQSVEDATLNLAAIIKQGTTHSFPWPVSFSFARALQEPALQAWSGNNKNASSAQAAFLERLEANTDALKK